MSEQRALKLSPFGIFPGKIERKGKKKKTYTFVSLIVYSSKLRQFPARAAAGEKRERKRKRSNRTKVESLVDSIHDQKRDVCINGLLLTNDPAVGSLSLKARAARARIHDPRNVNEHLSLAKTRPKDARNTLSRSVWLTKSEKKETKKEGERNSHGHLHADA